MKRSFLFLQGPCSPFFSSLADRLVAQGHRVSRVHFCAGDMLAWRGPNAHRFNRPLEDLPDFLSAMYERYGITDQVLFGDQRPVHRPAVRHAKACSVRTHVFEEGYFRPSWITLERDGVNANSQLPRQPDWYAHHGERLAKAAPVQPFKSPFSRRALHDVLYHVAGIANPLAFSRYQTHAGVVAPLEYAGYLKRFAWLRLFREREQRRTQAIAADAAPYYVLPLQLNSDSQIRDHSPFNSMVEVIEQVLGSFAQSAPQGARLVIKNHPLDTGLIGYAHVIGRLQRQLGLEGRVEYLEDGDLGVLLSKARGVVTVNSTVGMVALEKGRPTLCLSQPIYDMPGLTSQVALDEFWADSVPPDAALFQHFRLCVMHATQVNGGFYCASGIALAVQNSVDALVAQRSPLECLL